MICHKLPHIACNLQICRDFLPLSFHVFWGVAFGTKKSMMRTSRSSARNFWRSSSKGGRSSKATKHSNKNIQNTQYNKNTRRIRSSVDEPWRIHNANLGSPWRLSTCFQVGFGKDRLSQSLRCKRVKLSGPRVERYRGCAWLLCKIEGIELCRWLRRQKATTSWNNYCSQDKTSCNKCTWWPIVQ